MKKYIRLILLFPFFLLSSEVDAQAYNQVIRPVFDSLINEVKSLTKYESGIPIVYKQLEQYEWNLRSVYWDSIYESRGKIIRYPDSPDVKKIFCDSISPYEKMVFNKLFEIKKNSTDDILVVISNKNNLEISIYCFMLLCSDDNPKSKTILDHYLYSDAEIWVEECGQKKN